MAEDPAVDPYIIGIQFKQKELFEINNFGQTLREINNLRREVFYINM